MCSCPCESLSAEMPRKHTRTAEICLLTRRCSEFKRVSFGFLADRFGSGVRVRWMAAVQRSRGPQWLQWKTLPSYRKKRPKGGFGRQTDSTLLRHELLLLGRLPIFAYSNIQNDMASAISFRMAGRIFSSRVFLGVSTGASLTSSKYCAVFAKACSIVSRHSDGVYP